MARFGNTRDDRLALAIASGCSVRKSAKRVGLSLRTAHRRVHRPGFAERVAELRAKMFTQSLGRLAASLSVADRRLKALLRSKNEATALRAVGMVHDLSVRLRESVEMVARIVVLESTIRPSPLRNGVYSNGSP